MLQYLLATYSIDIIAGNFNYDLLKVLQNKFLDIFTDHLQTVNKPTHISEFLIDHDYWKHFFSGHDAVRIAIHKNYADFHWESALLKSVITRWERRINCFLDFLVILIYLAV